MSDQLPSPPALAYERFLKSGEFRLQHCTACSRAIFYPRTLCPHCGSIELEWRLSSGRGIVYSTTIVRQKPERGGDYNIALIDLAEGARLMSRVEGMPAGEVHIGMPVQAFVGEAGGTPLVLFRRAEHTA